MLPLLYFMLEALSAYMPSGVYPYSPLEELLMGVVEVLIIAGITLALASGGAWRIIGVLISGVPVAALVAMRLVSEALSGSALRGPAGEAVFAWLAMVIVGFYFQLVDNPARPFGPGTHGKGASPLPAMEPHPLDQADS